MSQPTTRIVMFPGTDALEDANVRNSLWKIPSIKQKILETQAILESAGANEFDFETFMIGEKELDIENFFKNLIFCSLAAQVAIFEDYEKQGLVADYLFGISLGDIARNVSSGVGEYKIAVIALLQFAFLVRSSNADFTNIGSSYFVKIPKPIQDYHQELKLDQYNLKLSVHQNDRFFLLAGMNNDFLKWDEEIGKPLGLKLKFMYPFALHCDLMTEVAAELKPFIYEVIKFEKMKYPLFSSITQDIITTEQELKEEINMNIVKTVRIVDTIKAALDRFEHVTFVNIGPAPTLITFIRLMGLDKKKYAFEDYFQNWLAQQEQIA